MIVVNELAKVIVVWVDCPRDVQAVEIARCIDQQIDHLSHSLHVAHSGEQMAVHIDLIAALYHFELQLVHARVRMELATTWVIPPDNGSGPTGTMLADCLIVLSKEMATSAR